MLIYSINIMEKQESYIDYLEKHDLISVFDVYASMFYKPLKAFYEGYKHDE